MVHFGYHRRYDPGPARRFRSSHHRSARRILFFIAGGSVAPDLTVVVVAAGVGALTVLVYSNARVRLTDY